MLDDAAIARIVRYISGECTPEEAAATAAWIADDPARGRTAERLRQLWHRSGAAAAAPADADTWDVDAAWRRFSEEALEAGPDARSHRAKPQRTPILQLMPIERGGWSRPWARVALAMAATIAVAAASVLLTRVALRRPTRPVAAAPDTTVRQFVTAAAQRLEIRLSDGSLAVLAPASRLRMPATYGTTARELTLEGEGYFEVRHDAARPFRVRIASGVIEDLGTKFGIRAYGGDSTARVVVTEGLVRLRPAGAALAPVELKAGELGLLTASAAPTVRALRGVDRYLAWRHGQLAFRNTPLREMTTELRRWYALDVRLADPALGRLVFTGTFRDESVPEVLRALEIALDIRADRAGNVVTLRSARPTSPQ